MEEGGQALKVNNGGERSPKTLLVQGRRRRVFIGGEKYGRWKQPAGQFGGMSGGAGLWAGRSGGPPDESGEGSKMQPEHQFGGTTRTVRSTAGRSGGPPDGSGDGPKSTAQKPNNFCKETLNEMKPILLES
jgi:hypothetical protein